MNKNSYIVGETATASATFSNGANCTSIAYTGLKTFNYEDIGLKPSGTVKVSAVCLYNSQVYQVSENCPAFEVEDTPKPSLTCGLDKTEYSVGDMPNASSVVTPNGATCGTPSITGRKTFTIADEGSYPAGTIKASVSCTYKSVALPVATQNCPAFTVKSGCPDYSSYFCSTSNVVVWNPTRDNEGYDEYRLPTNEICLKIPRSLTKLNCDVHSCSINGGEYFIRNSDENGYTSIEKFPNDECGYVYIDLKRATSGGWENIAVYYQRI
jgi:hypothetical protein